MDQVLPNSSEALSSSIYSLVLHSSPPVSPFQGHKGKQIYQQVLSESSPLVHMGQEPLIFEALSTWKHMGSSYSILSPLLSICWHACVYVRVWVYVWSSPGSYSCGSVFCSPKHHLLPLP